MHWLDLPEPRENITLAFSDLTTARTWLAAQPQAQPLHMLAALRLQIEAIDAAPLPPSLALDLLGLLRTAAVPHQASIESRYTRKALPMQAEDQRSFDVAQQLWTQLGLAYLRLAPHLPPGGKSLPLNRAACAFRMAQFCHFQAARACPPLLDQLLLATLAQAERDDLMRLPLSDPDFPHLGEANIAGHLAWAFLLRLIDPYHLTATQLAVANRALSRWRELASFHVAADEDPKAQAIDLAPLFRDPLPDGIPRWLSVRSVTRKMRHRIEALEAGESPESLKLGRELSGSACIRLLKYLASALQCVPQGKSTEIGEIEISFGSEHAYAVLKGEFLNPVGTLDARAASLAHQRMALFGFDRVSQMPTAVKKLTVPSEKWTLVAGRAIRPADQQGDRRLTPCLIASNRQGRNCLGVMRGLQSTADGALTAQLRWFSEQIEAVGLQEVADKPRVPAFLLQRDTSCSLILPASMPVRLEETLKMEGLTTHLLVPTEVLDRGVDFVRYACRAA